MVVIQIFSLLSLLFIPAFAQECGISNPIEEQKTEGIAPLGKWPWQVYVYTPQAVCGGTIIAERWVLTAAHCFQAQLNGEIFDTNPQIRAGVVNIKELDGSKLFDVLKFYTHEEFENRTYKNDIALLQLEHPIAYSKTISPICLANKDQNITVDQEAWIAGFGRYIDDTTGEVTQYSSSILRETSIRFSLHSKCKARYDNNGNADHLICAGSHGIGAGRGDSGGPLMVQSVDGPWYQVGVVSIGESESVIAKEHTIGGYTFVGHYCEWIKNITRGDATCTKKEVEMKLLSEEEREIEKEETENADEEMIQNGGKRKSEK